MRTSTGWKLLLAVTVLLLLTHGEGSAQDAELSDPIIFWSSEGPVGVGGGARIATAGPPDPERLLRALLEGPDAQQAQQGIWTAIPRNTTLVEVSGQTGETLTVRLDMPLEALQGLDHESFEIIQTQIGDTLMSLAWRNLKIQVRDPVTDTFVPLAQFLPQVTVPAKPSAAAVPGQPSIPAQAQREGELSGKTVYVSAGHGWQWVYSYAVGAERWETQRPPYPDSASYEVPIIEDHNNAEAVNQYLLSYLQNAGAMVWTTRERDLNGNELLLDDSADGFAETGWAPTPDGFGGQQHEAETVVGPPTAAASWSQPVPADGRYAVYVWYSSGADRPHDAQYVVQHAGGETTVAVDQRYHGFTWHYIGTFGFLAGEEARVTLSNQSSVAGRTIVADAVRFGGGTFNDLAGIDTAATRPPNKPWWEVASFYYTQRMGMDAAYGDVTARPTYARWEHAGTGEDAVYVSWHTNGYNGNQSQFSGTETYAHNGESLPRTEGSLELRHAIHSEVVHDIRAGWDPSWVDRGEKQRNLGELRLLWDDDASKRMPGALIEIAFHDHPEDTDALKQPAFNRLVARAIYQGIVKYFDPNGTLLPEPPTHLAVENIGAGRVRVSWQAPPTDDQGLGGDGATGYRVYTSANGIGWSNGVPVSSGTSIVLDGRSDGDLVFVRVTATNAGGESLPSETLAARVGEGVGLLLVNGFDRLNGTMVVDENDPVEGRNGRMLLDRMNRYDYVIEHGQAIASHAFDSASNEAVQVGTVSLNDYTIVDWILGEESYDDETLNRVEQALLKAHLDGGGALFVSGSEIAWDLDYAGNAEDRQFCTGHLRATYVGDDAGTYEVAPAAGSAFTGLNPFRFDAPGMYDPDYPDQLSPFNGSTEALRYVGGGGGIAAVQYADGCERLITFGFPFETIHPDQRNAVMAAVLGFLDECTAATVAVDTAIDTPTDGSAHKTPPPVAGTAYAESAVLDRVEVSIRQTSTGAYWDSVGWVAEEAWLPASGVETWSSSLPASLPDGEYHLRARGRTTDGLADASPAEVIFSYDTTPPASTTLITPTGGAVIAALPTLTLDWSDVGPDAGTDLLYRVELDDETATTVTSSYIRARVAEGLHTWRVRVEDAAGNASPWTPREAFTVSRLHTWLPLVLRGLGGGPPPCTNVIVNGGFESDAGWTLNKLAIYQTDQVRSGARSARVGIPPGEPGVYIYSSINQTVELPAGRSGALRLWVYPVSENNDPDDLHYVWLEDQWGGSHALELTTSDSREWTPGEYDLTDYLGQTVTIWIGAKNDGDDDTAAVYVDDVELAVCP